MDAPSKKQKTGNGEYHQPDTLLLICSRAAAESIRARDVKKIPVDLYEHLQRHMHPRRQKAVFSEAKKWYDNGQLLYIENWKDGKMNGEWKVWYPNGRLMCIHNWKDGKRDGEHKGWDPNGNILYIEYWEDGKIEKMKVYNQSGE